MNIGGLVGVRSTIALIGALGCLSLAWIYAAPLTYSGAPPIRSDGTGYYLYLPALLLDHDITMRGAVNQEAEASGTVRAVPPHGYLLDQFAVGEAVMLAPFFGAGYVLAGLAHEGQTGFTRAYQTSAAVAGLVYALLGLVVLGRLLEGWFRRSTVVVTLVAITFGTDLFHYATYDSTFSHAFSFVLVALTLRLAVSVWQSPRPSAVAALGAVTGLLALVRPTNAVILVFCALVGVQHLSDIPRRAAVLIRRFDLLALGGLVAACVYLLQVAYWYKITGRPFIHSYPAGQNLELLHPHLLHVLFSVRKGLFFWTPVLFIAVAGLPSLRHAAPGLLVPAAAYLVVPTWLVSSWTIWWYGASFGMRPFVEAMPVFALGLAAVIDRAKRNRAGWGLYVAVTGTTLLAVHAMLAYWTKAIPIDGTTLREYLGSFRHP